MSEKVTFSLNGQDVTAEPGMRRGVATLASFLDRQHDPELQDLITYVADDGVRCATSFLTPKSVDDIKARGQLRMRAGEGA